MRRNARARIEREEDKEDSSSGVNLTIHMRTEREKYKSLT